MTKERKNRRELNGWVSFLRFLIWIIILVAATLGINLANASIAATSLANGTVTIKQKWASILLISSLIAGVLNFAWGTFRWGKKWFNKNWSINGAFWRFIGGTIWRVISIAILIGITTLFILPKVNLALYNEANKEPELIKIGSDIALRIFDELDKKIPNITEQEALKLLQHALGADHFEINADASSNISTKKPSLFTANASALTQSMSKLNKVILTRNENFVIFYTDTGDDKIADEQVRIIGDKLETIVEEYKNKFGLEYITAQIWFNGAVSKSQIQEVLRNNGVDENILDTKMPIYIADPYEEESLTAAFYAGYANVDAGVNIVKKLGDLFDVNGWSFSNSMPTFPNLVIRPEYAVDESFEEILTHELGHHYEAMYCYSTSGEECKAGLFPSEAISNFFAAQISQSDAIGTVINDHHDIYLDYACNPIDSIKTTASKVCGSSGYSYSQSTFEGYPPFAFLQNYYEIVPGSVKIFLEANNRENPLEYLYEQAGKEAFQKIMIQLSERNITSEYNLKNNILKSFELPHGETLLPLDFWDQSYFVSKASSNYYYLTTTNKKNSKLTIKFNTDTLALSVFGKKINDDNWQKIVSGNTEKEYLYEIGDSPEYDQMIFVVTNYAIDTDGLVTFSAINPKLIKIVEEIIPEYEKGETALNLLAEGTFKQISDNCYDFNTSNLFEGIKQAADYATSLVDIFYIRKGDTETYENTREDREKIKKELHDTLDPIQQQLSPYKITVCQNKLKRDMSFETQRSLLDEGITHLISFDLNLGNRTSVFAGVDMQNATGMVYLLSDDSNNRMLYAVKVETR